MSNWIIELVSPPGAFVVSQYSGALSTDELIALVVKNLGSIPVFIPPPAVPEEVPESLKYQELKNCPHRIILFSCPQRDFAKIVAEILTFHIPDAVLPWSSASHDAFASALEKISKIIK